MQKILFNLCLACCLSLLLFACGAEDGDLTPPDVTFDGGINSPTSDTFVSLSGTMSADATIEVDVNPTAAVSNLIAAGGVWSCDVTGLEEGGYVIYVTASDPVVNSRQLQINVVVDWSGPVVTIGQFVTPTPTTTQILAGTVDEFGAFVEISTDGGGSWSAADFVDGKIWQFAFAGAEGTYDIRVRATDRVTPLSNTTDPADYALAIVVVDSTTPAPAFAVTSHTLPILTANASEPLVGTVDPLCELKLNGTVVPVAAGVWTANLGLAGTRTATFDICGGGSVQKILTYRDLDLPVVVEWSSPTLNSIQIEFSEPMDAATIAAENLTVVDSAGVALSVLSVTADSDRTFTFTTDLLTVGETYTVTVLATTTFTATDSRGNSIGAGFSWTFKK